MMRYVFHPEALAEYAEAAQYYATQNAPIAQDFVNAIEAAIGKIRDNLERHSLIEDDIQR
jgi:toxin ParE1/3/4